MKNTIDFFKEIASIPRESGHEEKIADYIESFAKEKDLNYIRDEYNNIIIKKNINDSSPIILQAHLDMVCEKEEGKTFDFANDSIDLIISDRYITADGTTLGADDGIGVAQILNVLNSNINRNIEAIFTVAEETSMLGAEKIDLSGLKGKTMINLDGFEADTILVGAASFTDIDIITNYNEKEKVNNLYKIKLSGLKGGHSGDDINKKRGNSNLLLTELLLNINDLQISDFNGGNKINVIPSSSEVVIKTDEKVEQIVNSFLKAQRKVYNNLNIELESISEGKVLSKEDTNKFLNSIITINHGVISTNDRDEVVTSKNLSVVNLKDNLIRIGLRSSNENERLEIVRSLKEICKENSYKFKIVGHQPGFCTSEHSNLVKKLKDNYYNLNNENPFVKTLHVGLEVGLLKEKIKDLEVAVISPNIIGAHTTEEKVEIASIEKCDRWLFEFLNS